MAEVPVILARQCSLVKPRRFKKKMKHIQNENTYDSQLDCDLLLLELALLLL